MAQLSTTLSLDTEKKEVKNLLIAPYGKTADNEAYQPNPTQARVLDWVDRVRAGKHSSSGIPILYLQGGMRAGKTRAFLASVIECLLEEKGLRMLWGRQDFADLRLSAMETFFEVLPSELITGKSIQEHRYVIGQGKSQIFFRELKDLGGLGSQEFGVIVITEVHEISHNAFRILKTRCMQSKQPNMILMEGNPPNTGHWLDNLTIEGKDEFDQDVEKWEISMRENWDNLPIPYRNSVERLPLSWRLKYIDGKTGFTPEGKPFYQGFNEILHKKELQYIAGKVIYRGIDFGFFCPAICYLQFDAQDRLMVLAELMGSEITIDKFADKFIAFENQHFPNTEFKTFYDPAGEAKTDKSERTSVEILQEKGITGSCKQSTYRERKELIEQKLSTLIYSLPALIVDEKCQIIIDGFLGGYHYPKEKEGQEMKEEPVHNYYSHLLNALEYVLVNLCSVVKRDIGKSYYPEVYNPMTA